MINWLQEYKSNGHISAIYIIGSPTPRFSVNSPQLLPLQLCNFLTDIIQFLHPCKFSWSNGTWTILLRMKQPIKMPSCHSRSSFTKAEDKGGTQPSFIKFYGRCQIITQQPLSMPHNSACETGEYFLCPFTRWDSQNTQQSKDTHNVNE